MKEKKVGGKITLKDRPDFCLTCPLYRGKEQGCRLLRHLKDNSPTLLAESVNTWNLRAKDNPQEVVSKCSEL